jgi:peptide chain release factor 1
MREILEQQLARFAELERWMVDPDVLANPARLTAIAREHGSIAKSATKYRRFKQLNAQIAEVQAMAAGDDPELRQLAEIELLKLKTEREACWNEILDSVAGGEDAQRTRCMLEIRAGTGGDEAALFARDLYDMYRHYCEAKGWKVEVMDMNSTELGGFKEVILGVEGEGVFRAMQYENGGHRVQRVPETETKGRIHTSAATVAVMAEPEDMEIDLKPADYVVERIRRASGPGGQHVNKTASAIRLTHTATGLEVCCQDEKSQHKNLSKALRVLKSRLYEMKREAEMKKRSTERREKIGSGDRNERIRTYNFPQNRLTDHRINQNFNLENVIAGNLGPVFEALIECDRQAQRKAFGNID